MEKPRKRVWLFIGSVMALVLALGITVAFAQEGEDTETPEVVPEGEAEDESANPSPSFGHFGDKFGHGMRGFDDGLEGITPREQLLADALGIELDDLVAAQESAYAAWLEEMVANGYMDQEQADLILAYQALEGNIDRQVIIASVLDLTVDELEAATEDGRRLSSLIEEQGLTVEEFMASLESAYHDAVQDLVPEVLTQEQADQIFENGVGIHGFGGEMHGFGRGMHGHGGGMHGFGSASPGFQSQNSFSSSNGF